MTSDLSNTPKRQQFLRNALWYGGFWLLLTLWLRLCLPESLMGWERHQLFRFSTEYLTFFAQKPYPILLYLQAFFTQFYLYPLLGAAVISGLLISGMGAWHRLTKRYWTGALWTAFMLPLLPYFNLLWVLVWLVLLGGGLLINLRNLTRFGRLGLTATCGLLGCLLLGENIVFALVFWSIINGLHTHSLRNGLYGLASAIVGTGLGIALITGIGYPLFYAHYLTRWPLLSFALFHLYPFPANFFHCPPFLQIWVYIGLAVSICLPFAILSASLKSQPNFAFLLKYGLPGLACTGLLISAAYLNLHYQLEDFYLVDRLATKGRWTEAVEAAELAFFQRARPEATNTNHSVFLYSQHRRARTLAARCGIKPAMFQNGLEEGYMADMLKICLLADRQATNKLFAYNGSYYFPLLFPEEILYTLSSYLMAFYDTQNGLYAEALHIFYDCVTSGRISTAVLEPLLWNSVVVGDYGPCRKFIRFFEQSLFHKDIARRYTAYVNDTAQTALQPEIAAARTRLSTHNHTVLAYHPDDNMYFRIQHEADNTAVYEYALALWMVYKNHERILAELPKIRQYYYQHLPLHIQEAVLACFPMDRLNEVPEDINPNIKSRYMDFLQTYGLYQNGYTSFQKLKKRFEDTYWYHLYFNDFKTINEPSLGQAGKI